MNVIVVTATGNAWHSDFVGVYKSLKSASADLDGVVWHEHTTTKTLDTTDTPYTYWTGTDPDLSFNTYAAHSEVVK